MSTRNLERHILGDHFVIALDGAQVQYIINGVRVERDDFNAALALTRTQAIVEGPSALMSEERESDVFSVLCDISEALDATQEGTLAHQLLQRLQS